MPQKDEGPASARSVSLILVRSAAHQGNGKVAKKEMTCLMNIFGQGLVQLSIDPKSHMMDAGVFGPSQIGLSYDSVAQCDLLMTPAEP